MLPPSLRAAWLAWKIWPPVGFGAEHLAVAGPPSQRAAPPAWRPLRPSLEHGVFAPHSQHRAAVTPAQRGRGAPRPPASDADPAKVSTPRHVAMSWARRLKRVFGVEIEGCVRCGGQLKIIASIEEPQLIAKILSHLERAAPEQSQSELALRKRGPPAQSSLL